MAHNTIKNYASDLETMGEFLRRHKLDFKCLGLVDFDNYQESLRLKGLKPNSRRRKIMTAKTFLKFMSAHIRLSTAGADRSIPPEKVEKPPKLVSLAVVEQILREQPPTDIGVRNRALIRVLLESGALVSEVLSLKKTDCSFSRLSADQEPSVTLSISGSRAREARLGRMAAEELKLLLQVLKPTQTYLFYGYSKGGPNPEKLTSRGVEVIFKAWSKRYDVKQLKPRLLRHLFILRHLLRGQTEAEVMPLLGLRTPYIFRLYRAWLDPDAQRGPELEELRLAHRL